MLITEPYRAMNAELHGRAVFGQRGGRHADAVHRLLKQYGPCRVLDYGCGQGALAEALPDVDVVGYDPAIPRFAPLPPARGMVVCSDVLEHIEPECLASVLAHLASCTLKVAYIVVATKPDGHKKLLDGRDPHLIVKPPEWWSERLNEHFRAQFVSVDKRDCTFLAFPRVAHGAKRLDG
jgi:SAM-dependent methyltransferase